MNEKKFDFVSIFILGLASYIYVFIFFSIAYFHSPIIGKFFWGGILIFYFYHLFWFFWDFRNAVLKIIFNENKLLIKRRNKISIIEYNEIEYYKFYITKKNGGVKTRNLEVGTEKRIYLFDISYISNLKDLKNEMINFTKIEPTKILEGKVKKIL